MSVAQVTFVDNMFCFIDGKSTDLQFDALGVSEYDKQDPRLARSQEYVRICMIL